MRIEPRVPAEALAAIRAPFVAAGAEAVEPPLLQPLGLLLDLAGEALRARLFIVQSEGGEESCLRPDFTVPVARLHLQNGAATGRYLYEGAAFRAASDQPGRPEEFRQIGVEIYETAETSPLASDIEAASLAWTAAAAGGRRDLTLHLGDVALFAALVESLDLPPGLAARLRRAAGRPRLLQGELARAGAEPEPAAENGLATLLSGLTEAQAVSMLEEVWALAGIERVGGRGPAEIAQRLVRRAEAANAPALTHGQADAIRNFLAIDDAPAAALVRVGEIGGARMNEPLEAWLRRLEGMVDAVPVERVRFVTALGHSFDYYDGATFEVRSAALGADRPVAVGGRYDSLPARLGGAPARAVGCMVRPWRAFAGGEA